MTVGGFYNCQDPTLAEQNLKLHSISIHALFNEVVKYLYQYITV